MWYQLQIEPCHPDEVESLSSLLEESGAISITLTDKNDEPVLEPAPGTTPLWPDIIVNALYSEKALIPIAEQQLTELYPALQLSVHELPDQDWERAWMKDFKPQQFGNRLWVCPSWEKPPHADAINLILDPGLAFGTGTHPTTRLCLNWLAQADLQNKTLIDYGCGSGILALAALKLGAGAVHAVDIDHQALQATESNAAANAIPVQTLHLGFPESLTVAVDVLIANILLAPLLSLQDTFHSLLKNQGVLVVSGLLAEQAPALIDAYQQQFIHHETQDNEGWSLLVFTCR